MDYKFKYFKYRQKYINLLGGYYKCNNPNTDLLSKLCKIDINGEYDNISDCIEQCLKKRTVGLKDKDVTLKNIPLKNEILKLMNHETNIRLSEKEFEITTDKVKSKLGKINEDFIEIPFYKDIFESKKIKIINALMSRVGDITVDVDTENIFKTNKNWPNLSLFDSFIRVLYYLKYVNEKNGYKILPSPYDSYAIDSKLSYTELLLKYNLCDPETMIFYFNYEEKRELIEKRSEKTKLNLKNFIESKTLQQFYLKIPFSGSSRCTYKFPIKSNINTLNLFEVFIENILKKIYKNVFLNVKFCQGYNLGIIIQPFNKYFGEFQETRCVCYKGEIKIVISYLLKKQAREIRKIKKGLHLSEGFYLNFVHPSVYEKKLDNYEFNSDFNDLKTKTNIIKNCCIKIIKNTEYFDNNINNDFTQLLNQNRSNILRSNISYKCKKAYNIIKSELGIEGDIHRIDFVNSRDDKNKYVINEIENLNFGDLTNFPQADDRKINFKIIHDDLQNYKNKLIEDKIINPNNKILLLENEIKDFFEIDDIRESMINFLD